MIPLCYRWSKMVLKCEDLLILLFWTIDRQNMELKDITLVTLISDINKLIQVF